ncbi:hypothetical protein OU426_17255 [Frigidibacter sp. RF13]|nr:hypothetical protein [Frigidibacter sp. RF13]
MLITECAESNTKAWGEAKLRRAKRVLQEAVLTYINVASMQEKGFKMFAYVPETDRIESIGQLLDRVFPSEEPVGNATLSLPAKVEPKSSAAA